MNVSDPLIARKVLKVSSQKGYALEQRIAIPAWRPILSLESVDGDLWLEMKNDFHRVTRLLPPQSHIQEIARKNSLSLLRSTQLPIDSLSLTRLSLACFIEYVFEREWDSKFEVFVRASLEWRKEIAIRGKADEKIKEESIDVLLNELILPSQVRCVFVLCLC